MKKFAKKTKQALIAFLVFVFALTLCSPALADVGLGIRIEPTGSQNFYYGKATNPLPAGTNFILMEQPSGTMKFKVDGSGKVYSASNQYCDLNGNNCMSAGGSSQWTTSGSNIYFTGNIGIGTSNVSNWSGSFTGINIGYNSSMMTEKSSAGDLRLFSNVYYDGSYKYIANGYATGVWLDSTAGGNSGGFDVETAPSGSANGAISWTDVFHVGNNGNVGIGTASPSAKLHVYGGSYPSFKLENAGAHSIMDIITTGAFEEGIRFFHGATRQAEIYTYNGDGILRFNNSSGDVMAINGGNVGIGTNNPRTKLEVYGSSVASPVNSGTTPNSVFQIHTSSNVTLDVGSLTGSPYSIWMQTDDVTGYQWHYPLALNPLGGNIGVGTTDPTAQMSGTQGIGVYSPTYPAIGFKNSTANWLWYADGSTFKMWNSSAGDMLIANTSGNVGIGTPSPNYKLDVNGDIRAQGAWLRTTGNTGWYSDSYGGGMYMQDSTWVRTYGSKSLYVDQSIRADNGLISGGVGSDGAGTLHTSGSIFADNGAYVRLDSYNNNGYYAMNNSGTYWGLMGNYSSNDWRLGYGSPGSLTGWNMRWDASGNAWVNNSLGVGGNLNLGLPGGTGLSFWGANGSQNYITAAAAGGNVILGSGSGNANLYVGGYNNDTSDPSIVLSAPNTYITGGLGVGTNSVCPVCTKIQVEAGTAADAITANGNLYGIQASAKQAAGAAVYARNTNGSGYDFYGAGPQSYFSGNVGIGVTNPLSALHVEGAQMRWTYSADDVGLLIHSASGGTEIMAGKSDNLSSARTLYLNYTYGGNISAGGLAYKPGGGSWSNSSDQRIKKDIVNLDGKTALDKLTSLQAKEYKWINPDAHFNDTGVHTAIMAQDLQKVFPTWVSKTDPVGADKALIPSGDQVLNVSYPNDFNAYLIQALKELKKENEDLKARVDALEKAK